MGPECGHHEHHGSHYHTLLLPLMLKILQAPSTEAARKTNLQNVRIIDSSGPQRIRNVTPRTESQLNKSFF